MNGFIFGFQRLARWPKWTPFSISESTVSAEEAEGAEVGAAVLAPVDCELVVCDKPIS